MVASLPALPLLDALQTRGVPTGILSNGSPEMLAEACDAAGLTGALTQILSVESAGVFKPSPRVYDLVGQAFGVAPSEVLFVSSNGWDVAGAAQYGFQTVWVNRAGDPVDRLDGRPDRIASDLTAIADMV